MNCHISPGCLDPPQTPALILLKMCFSITLALCATHKMVQKTPVMWTVASKMFTIFVTHDCVHNQLLVVVTCEQSQASCFCQRASEEAPQCDFCGRSRSPCYIHPDFCYFIMKYKNITINACSYIWLMDLGYCEMFSVFSSFIFTFDKTWKGQNKKSGWGTRNDTCGFASI